MKVNPRAALGGGLVLSAALVLCAASIVERRGSFDALKREIQSRKVPVAALRAGGGSVARLMEYKSRIGIELHGIDGGLAPEAMPSSVTVPPALLAGGAPLLSIVVDPDDLYDPDRGILANPTKRGRKWERPAYVSFFERGRLVFATGAGLRVHGGKSRTILEPSLRIHFRSVYGHPQFARGRLFEGRRDPLRSLVVHNDVRRHQREGPWESWRFVGALAYDVSERIGCLVPATQAAWLVLNGEDLGPRILTEHLGEDDVAARLGHWEFVLADTKPDRGQTEVKHGDRAVYEDFLAWARRPEPLTLEQAAVRVDIENLSRWFLSVLYLGPSDENQGMQVLDLTRPGDGWFWINWDMDHSFVDRYHRAEYPWEFDAFQGVLVTQNSARGMILERLLRGSPEFREYLKRLAVDVLNHLVTREFVEERIGYYETLAATQGIEDRAYVAKERQFVAHRHAALREQMGTYLDGGRAYRCRVTSRETVTLEVDGFPTELDYEGWYFDGMRVTVAIPEADRARLFGWRVNGENIAASGPTLTATIDRDTTIEAVFPTPAPTRRHPRSSSPG